ncbi:MAG: energy transducer TonB [Deltaproteobacteria bacterium]|nr:energy transducer TonB [Deltaproteobacteria bacterium]
MRAVLPIALAIACAPLVAATARAQPKTDAQPKTAAPAPAGKLVAPRQISAPVVPYPEGASGDAVVVVQLVVDVDGSVASATVVEGEEPFASAARASAMDFRFDPATRDGVPVRATIRARIEFHPRPAETPAETAPVAAPPAPVPPGAPKPLVPGQPVDIVVEGERKEVATTTIGGGEVKILPGAFGDPFRVIEALPGVTPLISGLPFFYVRGAPPGNTGYLIDGVKVPMLFHLGAGPSVLAPGLIDRVDFHPGGYPARYGRFTGGIVAGETVGAPKRLRGEWNVRLFDASALVESPLAAGKGEALAAGRYGYPGLLLSIFSPDVSLQYWDYQLRAGYRPTERDRISVFFFGAYDKLRDKKHDTTLFDAQFHRGDLRWDRTIPGGNVRVAATLMFDQSGLGDDGGDDDRFKVQMHGVGLRAEMDKRLDPAVLFRGGADVWFERYRLVITDDVSRETAPPATGGPPRPGPAAEPVAEGTTSSSNEPRVLFPSRADVIAGARADLVLKPTDRVELVPVVRIDVFSQGNATVPAIDPRLAARLRVARKVWSITTLGVTHQTPAFLVPFPGLRVATLDRGLQEAFQMAQGVEVELPGKPRATACTRATRPGAASDRA